MVEKLKVSLAVYIHYWRVSDGTLRQQRPRYTERRAGKKCMRAMIVGLLPVGRKANRYFGSEINRAGKRTHTAVVVKPTTKFRQWANVDKKK